MANTATSEALLTGIIEALKLLSAKAEATVRGDAARTKTNTQALRNAAQQAAESAELRPPLLRGTKILFQFSPLMQFGLSGVEAKQGKHSLKRLTYAPNGTTNRTSIVVNGKEVIFGSDAGWWSDRGKQEMLPTRPDRKDRLGIQSEWIYKNGDVALRVRQVLEILRDDQRELNTCVIGYVIDNDGDGRLSVGLQAELDTKIDTNDHNPFAASDKQTGKESLITAARMFNSPELPPYVKALQKASLEDPGYLGYFSLLLNAASDGLTPPTSFLIANLYQLPPATSPIKLPQPAPKLDDSAVAIRWDPPPLPKGGRRTMVYAFGLGKLTLAEAASQNAWILELANERKDSPK